MEFLILLILLAQLVFLVLIYQRLNLKTNSEQASSFRPDNYLTEPDDLFDDAVKLISKTDKVSAAFLQRNLSIGYARAARLIDQLYNEGLISDFDGANPRTIHKPKVEKWLKKSSS